LPSGKGLFHALQESFLAEKISPDKEASSQLYAFPGKKRVFLLYANTAESLARSSCFSDPYR
jgi:hypothetical protein